MEFVYKKYSCAGHHPVAVRFFQQTIPNVYTISVCMKNNLLFTIKSVYNTDSTLYTKHTIYIVGLVFGREQNKIILCNNFIQISFKRVDIVVSKLYHFTRIINI